jgi:hypothetical protein
MTAWKTVWYKLKRGGLFFNMREMQDLPLAFLVLHKLVATRLKLHFMRILPFVNLSTDEPFWVSRAVFLLAFDQVDFVCREAQNIAPAYRSEWFERSDPTEPRFILPVVQVVAGKTQFINGRHRSAVLLAHLEELPVAFATGHLDAKARLILDAIPKRPLSRSEYMILPDLPIGPHFP